MSILKTIYLQHLNGANANMTLESDGDVSVTGNVGIGIGTATPTYKVDINAGAQGTAANSQVLIQRFYTATAASGGNSNFLEITDTRVGAGSSWNGCGARIQHKVDADYQAYIQFNGNNDYGLSFGTGASTGSATGVVERMRIDSSGRVTMPYQPVFAASGSTTQSWSGSANYQTLQLNLQYVSNNSRGSGYNTSTYRFTAPVAGMYMFFGKITQTGTATGPSLFLFVNGNIANIYEMTIGYSVAYMSTSGLAPWYMNAGDYAELRVNNNNSVSQSLDLSRCNFVGWLLG